MALGVDLGGTKTEAAVLSDDGRFLARERIATPRSYEETLSAIAEVVSRAEKAAGVSAPRVGVGIPGSISPVTGLIRNANSTWLNGKSLLADLERTLGRPVRMANDANCFALSEATDGAAQGAKVVFGAILGTGCGGGVVVDGKVLEGASGVAGEWGHVPLPWAKADEWPGTLCWCGQRGCLETWISGSGLEADFHRTTALTLSAKEIAASADPKAKAAMDRYIARLARAFAMLVNILDPDVIVLGGGMSNVEGLAERAQALLSRHVFSDVVRTRIVGNAHGDSSGVRGAAWL